MDRYEGTPGDTAACSQCFHSAESHMHGNPLGCAFCALGPLAHAMGIGCSLYTLRTAPHSGGSCRVLGCECRGYAPQPARGGPVGTSAQELFGGDGRQ
jgi:hypothetical protein